MPTSIAAALLALAAAAAPAPRPAGAGAGQKAPIHRADALVDAAAKIPDAVLDVRYATANNVTRRPLYPMARCLLQPGPAARLARAAAQLRSQGFRLVLHDCYRPLSVQKALWAAMPKVGYVADPATGSNHNRAAAVDVALADAAGHRVELPTDYDAFGPKARAGATEGISAAALRHRGLLRAAMEAQGWKVNPAEWWHFDAPEAAGAPLLDRPIGGVAR